MFCRRHRRHQNRFETWNYFLKYVYSVMFVCYHLKPNSPSQKNIWRIDCLKRWLLFQWNVDLHLVFRHSNGTLDGVKMKRAPMMVMEMKLGTRQRIGHLVSLYSRFGCFQTFLQNFRVSKNAFGPEILRYSKYFLGWPTKSSYWSSINWQNTKEAFTLLGLHFRWKDKSKNCQDSNATYWRSM